MSVSDRNKMTDYQRRLIWPYEVKVTLKSSEFMQISVQVRDITMYLDDQGLTPGYDWFVTPGPRLTSEDTVIYSFQFRKRDRAMLFKLTWI